MQPEPQEMPQEVADRISWLVEQYETARKDRDDLAARLKVAQVRYETYGEALDSAKYIANVAYQAGL
jgi:hypothetical protein